MADEMGLGKTFSSVSVAMICKLITEKDVMGLALPIWWGNDLAAWVNMAQDDYSRSISEAQECYLLQRLISVPHHIFTIQKILPVRQPVFTSALEPILVVNMA